MHKRWLMIVILGFFLVTMGCCVSKEDFEKKVGELETAKQENAKLEDLLKDNEAKIAELEKKSKERVIIAMIVRILRFITCYWR